MIGQIIVFIDAFLIGALIVFVREKLRAKEKPLIDPYERMISLCWTGSTLYGIDDQGRIWYIDMGTGNWELHGNPLKPQVKA